MAVINHSTLDQYQADVIEDLRTRSIHAQGWHSGGGIFGVLITLPSNNTLFSTLAADRQPGWTGFDWNNPDGDIIGTIEIQERPHGHLPLWKGDEPASPGAMARAIYTAAAALR